MLGGLERVSLSGKLSKSYVYGVPRTMKEQRSQDYESTKHQVKSTSERLGIIYDIQGVDPENVLVFAKVLRLLGFLAVAALVFWGFFGEWEYSDSPLETLVRELGVGYRYRDAAAYGIGGVTLLAGWFFRFHVGTAISAVVFGLVSLLGRIFKAV